MRLLSLILLVALLVLPAGAAAQTNEPFGGVTSAVTPADVENYTFLKYDLWPRLLTRVAREELGLRACERDTNLCSGSARWFLQLQASVSVLQGTARLRWLGRTVRHAIASTEDMDNWGEYEHWSSPQETLEERRADCEDYSILWWAILRRAGVQPADLQLLVVEIKPKRLERYQQKHVVLAVRDAGAWYLLDSRFDVRTDRQAKQYVPLFLIDERGVKKYVPAHPVVAQTTAAR